MLAFFEKAVLTELGVGQLPGSFHIFNESQQLRPKADFKLLSFLSVGTKQQSRLKYPHSLMSICLRLLVQHSLSRAQSNPSQIDTDTSTTLNSFDSLGNTLSKSLLPNTRFYSRYRIAGKSMPLPLCWYSLYRSAGIPSTAQWSPPSCTGVSAVIIAYCMGVSSWASPP